jgi:2',3'-cyclic-nucleotide 2'-phosphodiesterase
LVIISSLVLGHWWFCQTVNGVFAVPLAPVYPAPMAIRVAMLGDVVGLPGRQAIAQQMAELRRRYRADLVIANAENTASGSGLTPEQYAKLCASGVDGITLGDHVYKRAQIVPTLERQANIIRPANLPALAKGRRWMSLRVNPGGTPGGNPGNPGSPPSPAAGANVYVLTVLGRVFSTMPVDEPFAVIEQVLSQLPEKNPIVIVEIHAEATSEKQAIGWYLDGRVAAVLGTHTHVPTADGRVLPKGTAYMTDLGMCGPYESIIGRRIDRVLTHLTTSMPAPFDVAEGDPRVCGAVVEIDERTHLATSIERIELRADRNQPPFSTGNQQAGEYGPGPLHSVSCSPVLLSPALSSPTILRHAKP